MFFFSADVHSILPIKNDKLVVAFSRPALGNFVFLFYTLSLVSCTEMDSVLFTGWLFYSNVKMFQKLWRY